MVAKKRAGRTLTYTVSLDKKLVKRFRAACKRRDIEQSRAVTRMIKYYLAHRFAFGNGVRRSKLVKKSGDLL
jgi:metal-responsive CopG/Arc/MetJ family transcriptional regulator